METEQYLKYFNNNKKKPSPKLTYNKLNPNIQPKSLHLSRSKLQKKLLPHIAEEYEYKITNKLLVEKIINPKRDKLIIQSFHRNPSRQATRKTKSRQQTGIFYERQPQSLDIKRNEKEEIRQGHTSLYSRLKIRNDRSKSRHKTIKSYEQQFNLALQNERMGKRIIKTKSSVEQLLKKSFFTYKRQDRMKQFDKQNYETDLKSSSIRQNNISKVYFQGKTNDGIKVFYNPIKDDEKSLSQSKSVYETKRSQRSLSEKQEDQFQNTLEDSFRKKLRKNKTAVNFRSRFVKKQQQNQKHQQDQIKQKNPQYVKIFGKGPTILMIYDIQIKSNPPIKDSTILVLELITHEKRISFRKSTQKSIRTTPISYEFIKPAQNGQSSMNCVKFAINVSEIGDFVPLRIYKMNGVDIQELGIIDIDLAAFRYRKTQLKEQQNGLLIKEYKVSKYGQRLQREIISGRSMSNLRKNILNKPLQTVVSLNYKIYSKKYKVIQENLA